MILTSLFLLSCQSQDIDSVEKQRNEILKAVDMLSGVLLFDDTNKDNNIPKKTSEGISEEDAANLCRIVLGEAADDTGFRLAYRCVETKEFEDQYYYVMNMSWLVDDIHWSYIGEVMVSVSGDEIYSGAVDREGNYFLVEKLWEK
jgi:hypothetical protein